jgi:copper chaperone CopZ
MKTLVKITGIAVLAVVLNSNANAQMHDHSKMSSSSSSQSVNGTTVQTKTETLKVSGNCDMCKARIEKAAKIDGVTKAEWNKKDKMLTATFDPAKTNIDAIGKKIAAAGHDTEKAKATDAVYDKLPGCCQYR